MSRGPRRRMPKASGLTERVVSPCWKWRDARWGGSTCASSHPRVSHWTDRAAMNEWTAAVCSIFLSNWRLLPPVTLRHSSGPSGRSTGATLHRLLATPTDERSLRARTASPRSVRASRPSAAATRVTRPKPSSGATTWETRPSERFIRPATSLCNIQGQSASRSRSSFLGGLEEHGQRACGVRRQARRGGPPWAGGASAAGASPGRRRSST